MALGIQQPVNKPVSQSVSTYIFEAVFKLAQDVSDQDVVLINLPESIDKSKS